MEEKKENEKGLQKVQAAPPYPYPPPYYVQCDDDEIDLYELWLILKKRKRWVFGTIATFLAIALLYLFVAAPKFKSHAVYGWEGIEISSSVLSDAVNNLNTALREENYPYVAKKLNLPESEVKKIRSIEPQIGKRKSETNTLKVQITTTSRELIPTLSDRLKAVFNELPPVKEAIEFKKKSLATSIKTTLEQIKGLEKLKKELTDKLPSVKDPQLLSTILQQITQIETQILDKKATIEEMKLELEQVKGVGIAVKPIVPQKPSSPKPKLVIAVALISGLFTGVFLAFFREWVENARRKHAGESS